MLGDGPLGTTALGELATPPIAAAAPDGNTPPGPHDAFQGGAPNPGRVSANPADWTGVRSGLQRAYAIRAMFPSARAAVEALIADLESGKHNGGPLLEEREEALETLRSLHRDLGDLITLAEQGGLESGHGLELLGRLGAELSKLATPSLQDPLRASIVGVCAALVSYSSGLGVAGMVAAGVGAVAAIQSKA